MTVFNTRIIVILVVGIPVSLAGSSLSAETLYYTDFSAGYDTNPTDGIPDNWTTDHDGFAFWNIDPSSEEFISYGASDDSLATYDGLVSGGVAASTLTDYTVSATFHKAGGRAGLVGRLQDAVSFYTLRVRDTNRLELYWVGPNDTYERIGFSYMEPTYVNDDVCKMSMTFSGSDIICEVRNSSDEVMAEYTVTDTTYASGTAGLRSNTDTFGCQEFSIQSVDGLPGDFDNDGDVDGTDFLMWQRGESPNPLSSSDLTSWKENFGTVTSPMNASSAAVPEPAAGLMLILGVMAMFSCRRSVMP
ncbi:MAG: PEP-CTERM sorting domain-containing protein [Pirellulales bacterium]|nr:PEP-CTERM sorting domain-containing protein [Pirellulales bacterium]